MKNILARGGIEFLAVFIGIILSLYVDENRDDRIIQNKNIKNLRSLGKEIDQLISRTGSPSTSIFGAMPNPGSVDAAMRPLCLCGAPSAVLTVT